MFMKGTHRAVLLFFAFLSPISVFGGSNDLIRAELEKYYPGTRIEVLGSLRTYRGSQLPNVDSVQFIGDNGRGEAYFRARALGDGGPTESEISVSFGAFKNIPILQRRVTPGERLSDGLFKSQELNLAISPHRDLRGLILPNDTSFSKLEAHQTLVEGQYVLSSSVNPVPDVQRGEVLKIQLISAGLVLSTLATAEEPGLIGKNIRVMSVKNKRILSGVLLQDRSVEVQL